uniref:Uncharacterized protein n=1 Tax=Cucumis sativus TaxID=3659 RepID=A0A0A0LH80_CUCSA
MEWMGSSINRNFSNHSSALMRRTVERVTSFFSKLNFINLSGSVQKILLIHRDLSHINSARNFILIEHYVVWESRVVLERDFLPRRHREIVRNECQRTVVPTQQDLDGHGV